MTLQPKTLEEHREYLHKIVCLKLFYLHLRLEQHPEENFRYVIRERVDIYRKTDANALLLNPPPEQIHWDAPAWKKLEDEAERIYSASRNDRQGFEKAAFELFRPSLDARCERDFYDQSPLELYERGCSLRVGGPQGDGSCSFHIANAVAPHSIFDDPFYLPNCFIRILNSMEERFHSTRIRTRSWLNSHPRWLALFPDEWLENMSPAEEDIRWHYGFWGQFITGRGTFHEKNAEILRGTGKFPFALRSSVCSISALRQKLAVFTGQIRLR